MQLIKNKIFIASGLYLGFLIVIIISFGIIHNVNILPEQNGKGTIYISLLLAIVITTALYWTVIRYKNSAETRNHAKAEAIETEAKPLETGSSGTDSGVEVKGIDKDFLLKDLTPDKKKSLNEYCEFLLQNLARKLELVQAVFYLNSGTEVFRSVASYAYYSESTPPDFNLGETLPGQAAKDKRILIVQNIPENYIKVLSGLGTGNPNSILFLPVIAGNSVVGLIEMASFKAFPASMEDALKELGTIVGENIVKLTK